MGGVPDPVAGMAISRAQAVAGFSKWYRELSDEERAEQVRRAGKYLEATARPEREEAGGDDEWEARPILRREPRR